MTTFTTEDREVIEKSIANEPLAWTDGMGNYFDKNSFFPVDDLIPLYTHPAKMLTQEEIHKIWASENGLEDMDMCKYADFLEVFRFVESAILRKIGGK